MQFLKKLKPDRDFRGILPGLLTVLIFIITTLIAGIEAGLISLFVLAISWFLFSLIAFYRTKNIGYFLMIFYSLCMTFYFALVPRGPFGLSTKNTASAFIVLAVFIIFGLVYLMFTKKYKWRGRDILELAAEPVTTIENGFTPRPHPIGKLDYSKEEILEFAKFASKNLIAMPYIEADRVVLALVKMGREFGFLFTPNNNYQIKTWVAFDNEGGISVNISKEDYFNYKENLSFDKLCESLGNVFKDFFELFRKGEEVRIIDKMNDMKIAFLS